MAGKISEYANAVATFADGDLVDVSKRLSTSPDVFESQKLEFAQFQAFIQANASNILNTNGLTLGGMYSHNLNSNYLTFTNGTLNISQGSLLVQAETNLGSTAVLFSKLNGDPMWTFLDDGNLNLGSSTAVNLTDNLTFKDTSSRNVLNISNPGELQISAGGTMYGKMFTNGDWALGGSTIIGAQAGITLHRNTLIKSESNSTSNIAMQVTDTSNAGFFRIYGDKRLLFGNTSFVGSEDISLQSSTAIKGIGTSGSSALAIYDNDTTPNKLWDFLDNGNVNLGAPVVFGSTSQDMVKFESSGLNPSLVINALTANNNANMQFERGSVKKWLFGNDGSNDSFYIYNFAAALTSFSITSANKVNILSPTLTGGGLNIGQATHIDTYDITPLYIKCRGNSNMQVEIDSFSTSKSSQVKYSQGGSAKWLAGVNSSQSFYFYDYGTNSTRLSIKSNTTNISMPTSATGLSSGDLWNDGGTVKIA